MTESLLETIENGVAVITLNRPDSLNALDTTLMRLLHEAIRRVADDSSVACVVLTGAGRGFCAGGDMKAATAAARQVTDPTNASATRKPRTLESRVAWLRRSMEAPRLLHDMLKPTIAMINGPCAGAGLSLAGACDLRIGGSSAVFSSSFVRAGLSGDYGGSWFWTRILGTAKARQLYFLAEKMNAEQALAFGLVDAVHPDELLRERTMEIARRLAKGPQTTYAYIKRNLNAAEAGRMDDVFDLEALNMMLSRQALEAARATRSTDT